MPMNNRILRPLARPLLLDAVPGAAAAYSLRQLSNAYTGPVVTVRRSSDNAEADFTASEIDDGTLAAFCGAGDGFVKTWHDQSGNGRDASQATSADQPKAVLSGSLVLSGGKPAVLFAEANDFSTIRLQTAAFSPALPHPFAVFIAADRRLNDDRQAMFDGRTNVAALGLETNTGQFVISAGTNLLYGPKEVGLILHTGIFSSSTSSAYINGALGNSGDIGSNALDGITLGNLHGVPSVIANAYGLIGTISEVVVYPSDQSANRQRIEGDLAWYY